MKIILAFASAVLTCGVVEAATLVWTGGGASDNFSDPGNWDLQQAPVSGDSLTFAGETRTTPVNDLDPETYVFEKILFANDGSSGKAQPFTLSGNKLRVSHSIYGVQPSVALTEILNLDVESTTAELRLGGNAGGVNRHNFIFNGKVSGSASALLSHSTQYSAQMIFNGPIEGFTRFYRPNGDGHIYFYGANSAFAATGVTFNQGRLHIIDASNLGPAKVFHSGQGGYSTAGTLFIAPTNDVTLSAKIGLYAPSQTDTGLTLYNETAGKLVTFTGEVYEGGTRESNGAKAGTRLMIDGPGDGRFEGNFTKDRMAFYKNGTGTWTLGAEIESCALTGLVTLAKGKLRIDCTVPTYKVTVAASTTLAGAGTLGSAEIPTAVSFASGSTYELGTDAVGAPKGLTINGTVSLAANLPVNLPDGVTLAAGARLLLMRFAAKTGTGTFAPGTGFPSSTVFTVTETELYAEVPSETFTWTGAANAIWNKTSVNWSGDRVFVDRAPVVFPDLADETKRTIAVPAAVSPLSMSVTATADHPYVFTGEGGVEGASQIEFAGTATNTWAAPLRAVGNLMVSSGVLKLDGHVSGSTVNVASGGGLELDGTFMDGNLLVENGGTFTQTVDSVIGGSSEVALRCTTAVLHVTNTFTGGIALGWKKQEGAGNPSSEYYLRNPKALGAVGDVALNYNTKLHVNVDVAETNRTLHLWGYNNSTYIRMSGNRVFDWAGDVLVHEYPQGETFFAEGDNIAHFGKADGTSRFASLQGRSVTLVGGVLHLHANVESGSSFNFRGTMYVYGTNNVWGSFGINTGTAIMMAPNALPGNRPISMLQQWNRVSYYSTLDLNGFDQTVTAINTDYNAAVKNAATLKSATPATLTMSNTTASVFSDINTFVVTGALNLRKMGAAKWTLGCNNTSTGNVEVLEGTLKLDGADALPVGATSKLRMGEGAVLELAEGVAGEIAYAELIVGEKVRTVSVGVYGGPDCTVVGVNKVDWIAGAGTLHVRRQETAGTIVVFR